MELCRSQYCLSSPLTDLYLNEMVWDELDHRVTEKQPTSTQHLQEFLPDCWKTIPGGCLMKLKSVQIVQITVQHFFVYCIIPYMFFYCFDVFKINLQCKKKL